VATDFSAAEFAAMIDVPVAQLAALEREGLPTVSKSKAKLYPVPRAVTWYIEHAVARRVGGIPPRTNQQDLAGLLGIVPRQVKNLVDTGKLSSIVENNRRLYPLPLCVHEFVKYQRELVQVKKDDLDLLDQAKLRKLNAEAEQAEMDLLRKRGEMLDRVISQRAISELLQALRSEVDQREGRNARKTVQLSSVAKSRAVWREASNELLVRLGAAVAAVGRRIQIVAEDLTPDEAEEEVSTTPAEEVGADG
jgi:hypothetical protein